jgi:5-formyltetrahydrofolate cyclo-ligase
MSSIKESDSKKTIRIETLQRRDAIQRDLKEVKDSSIMHRVFQLPEFKDARSILFYASFRSEVDTIDMIKISLNMGKIIVMPKVDRENGRLNLYEIKNMNELVRGYMWILEPFVDEDRSRSLDDIDLVIIPGAAFDVYGNRLGYGAGYYDKLLSETKRKIPIIAPAYEEQVVEGIPAESHDVKVDKIITDKRVIECN